MTTLYGISNCDTVKKARRWLELNNVPYQFHDFRKDGMASVPLSDWIVRVGLETLVNKRSRTWKTLPDADKAALDEHTAVELLFTQPTLIKRPVIEHAGELLVGFDESAYEERFQ